MARRYADARIGIDLDNTLISYDRVFLELAFERALVPAGFTGSKREIRDRVRLLRDGETEWQHMQAHAYGPAICRASATEGALEFIRTARAHGADLMIVSHKTLWSNLGNDSINLRDAASVWLRENGILAGDAILENRVYFENSREEKIARITALRCTHFIDDLEELFNDARFPVGVERMLFGALSEDPCGYRSYASFQEIVHAFSD